MKIDIQYSPGANDWPVLRDAILRAEAEGYDTTWVFDHFDGAMIEGDRPMLECFTLLGALAAATSTIGLGHACCQRRQSPPSVAAAAASSVQRISSGRLTLGLGAGTAPNSEWSGEHVERGIPLKADIADRHAAVVEQIRWIRDLPEPMPIIVGVNSVRLADDRRRDRRRYKRTNEPTNAPANSSRWPATRRAIARSRSADGRSRRWTMRVSRRTNWASIVSC